MSPLLDAAQALFDAAYQEALRDPVNAVSYALNGVGVVAAATLTTLWNKANARRKRVEREKEEQARSFRADLEQFKSLARQELLDWGRQSIQALADAHVCLMRVSEGHPLTSEVRADVLARLSGAVDVGRLFFPNHCRDIDWPSWRERPSANKGFRDPILDALMVAHEEVRRCALDAEGAKQAADNTFAARRAFVSLLQDWWERQRMGLEHVGEAARGAVGSEANWKSVEKLVDAFEARHGPNSFWGERPLSRSQLLDSLARAGISGQAGPSTKDRRAGSLRLPSFPLRKPA